MKLLKSIKKTRVIWAVMIILSSCQTKTYSEREIPSTIESVENQNVFQGRVIPAVYEDYYMNWEDICVIIIGGYTYTEHFEGSQEFALIGYNGTENPLLLVGCTKEDGFGEYCVYCFFGKRVYKAEENLKGMLYYNAATKEFAVLDENQVWNIYTYYENHIIWFREEYDRPDGFEKMTLTSKYCSPPPMKENIRSFIFY